MLSLWHKLGHVILRMRASGVQALQKGKKSCNGLITDNCAGDSGRWGRRRRPRSSKDTQKGNLMCSGTAGKTLWRKQAYTKTWRRTGVGLGGEGQDRGFQEGWRKNPGESRLARRVSLGEGHRPCVIVLPSPQPLREEGAQGWL